MSKYGSEVQRRRAEYNHTGLHMIARSVCLPDEVMGTASIIRQMKQPHSQPPRLLRRTMSVTAAAAPAGPAMTRARWCIRMNSCGSASSRAV